MKYVVTLFGAIAISVASFFGGRMMAVNSISDQSSIFDTFERVGSTWLYSDKIGAAAASDTERARVALGGPLGLSSKEAVYFVATRDDQGAPLTSECVYQVVGQPIDTRWWSLTLYDSETQHYVPNVLNRSSWNSISVARSEAGEWTVQVASTEQDLAWLPAQEAPNQSFELILRVYNPSAATRDILPNIELPKVERLSC